MKIRPDSDTSLTAFLLAQLDALEDLRSRKMFGAHGVYAGALFFALVHQGKVYFKTSESTRGPYLEAGMEPFSIEGKVILKNYWQVPVDTLEDADTLIHWARTAIRLASEMPPRPGKKRR